MKKDTLLKWLDSLEGWLSPPGCEEDYAPLPDGRDGCCSVGVVHEHRFAFYFWALYSHGTRMEKQRPILVTIDSHDDVGVPEDFDIQDLHDLSLDNKVELALFAWARLRSLNDGHILPALYLDFFSDVYVLLNDNEEPAEFKVSFEKREQVDRNGRIHSVRYYQNVEQLLQDLPSDTQIFLDLDLDYFTLENAEEGSVLGSEQLVSDDAVESFLSIDSPLLRRILPHLIGLTIALEPRHCGGLLNSLHLLNILNNQFFSGTLCTHNCTWRVKGS